MSRTRRGVAFAACIGVMAALCLSLAPGANALSANDIRLSALSVNSGVPIGVTIDYLYSSKGCSLSLVGPKRTTARSYSVKKSKLRIRLSTDGLPSGAYAVRAMCGAAGSAISNPFYVVPKGSPTSATCDVTDQGFTLLADGSVTYGIQVTNRSPALTAEDVILAVNFVTASGAIVRSETDRASYIPPGESVYALTSSVSAAGTASLSVAVKCSSSTEKHLPLLRGQASYISPRDSSYYPTTFGGTLANPYPFALSEYSWMAYVTRNATGAITGGGEDWPDAFIPVGGASNWSELSELPLTAVSSVDFSLEPREAA